MENKINVSRLFLASRIALVATAMTFAIRADIISTLGTEFKISPSEMGIVIGTAFWGFTLSMMVGGFLCDALGMRKLLIFAFAGHVSGIVLTMLSTGFWSLFFSTLLVGIGNGMVEAACNPLVATLYPNKKTEKLNKFHVWFPGGIVIGGLVAYALNQIDASWQIKLSTIFIPTIAYGVLFFRQSFPVTERVSAGVTNIEMMRACYKPLFIFMIACMYLTAATELGTNQWLGVLLENVGVPSILLLVFINGLMALGRSFAGPIEHKFSSAGMLVLSAVFSALGLFLLGNLSGPSSFIAAGVFAVGICFFWPTMLGFISEHMPRTGALGLALMGGAGMLSVAFILPFIGKFYEEQTKLNLAPASATLTSEAALKHAQFLGGATTFEYLSIIPAILIIAFTSLYFRVKANKKKELNY